MQREYTVIGSNKHLGIFLCCPEKKLKEGVKTIEEQWKLFEIAHKKLCFKRSATFSSCARLAHGCEAKNRKHAVAQNRKRLRTVQLWPWVVFNSHWICSGKYLGGSLSPIHWVSHYSSGYNIDFTETLKDSHGPCSPSAVGSSSLKLGRRLKPSSD